MSVLVFWSDTVLMKCLLLEEDCLVHLAMRWCKFPEQGWRSGEGTCLPPMHPGFDFQTRRHTAVCGLSLLLVLFLAPRGFSLGTPVFPSPQIPI